MSDSLVVTEVVLVMSCGLLATGEQEREENRFSMV